MTRKERVYATLQELSKSISMENLTTKLRIGFTANEISRILNIQRNSVSLELNKLFRENKIIKLSGKPVLFIDKFHIESIIDSKIDSENCVFNSLSDIFEELKSSKESILKKGSSFKDFEQGDKKDSFSIFLKHNKSMISQIEQAKASVLYPFGGLNTIITGPTGAGKSHFAEIMYRYAVEKGVIANEASFIVFNCSEYTDNPQLIMSHLFGHKKGAFTGAFADKDGLVAKANGGFLFLDEIHNLPKEGQEMLFMLMDKGKYRSLGETDKENTSEVRIICATTENPSKILLKTFLRRIPIIINLPSLDIRPVEERLIMIRKFFYEEACRVSKSIIVRKNVIRCMLFRNFEGNIGEIKASIQFMCAKAFVKAYELNTENIDVDYRIMAESVKLNSEIDLLDFKLPTEIFGVNDDFFIDFKDNSYMEDSLTLSDYNILYDQIRKKMKNCNNESKKNVISEISNYIENYFECLLKKSQRTINSNLDLFKIVPTDILDETEKFLKQIESELSLKFTPEAILALSLHIKCFIDRSINGKVVTNLDCDKTKEEHCKEFALSSNFIKNISEKFKISYSADEAGFVTSFLLTSSKKRIKTLNDYAIVVLAHGENIATSTAKLANSLMGENVVLGIDMPLERNSNDIFTLLITLLRNNLPQKGILLIVDMGGLVQFAEKVWEEFDGKYEVSTISGLNIMMVIDIARKLIYIEKDMQHISQEVVHDEYIKATYYPSKKKEKNNIIYTTCITGIGTAKKIKNILESTFAKILVNINIIPIEFKAIKNMEFDHEKTIPAAIIGTFNPQKDNIPYISLEELLEKEGLKKICDSIMEDTISDEKLEQLNKNMIKSLSMEIIIKNLTFLNPQKVLDSCFKSIQLIENEFNVHMNKNNILRFLIHMSCVIERTIMKQDIGEYENADKIYDANKTNIIRIKKCLFVIEDSFNIDISKEENVCIWNIIKESLM